MLKKINCFLTLVVLSIILLIVIVRCGYYCGWLGMSSSDLASWVQAVGSILAILAAYALSQKSFDDAKRLADREILIQELKQLEKLEINVKRISDSIGMERRFSESLISEEGQEWYLDEEIRSVIIERLEYFSAVLKIFDDQLLSSKIYSVKNDLIVQLDDFLYALEKPNVISDSNNNISSIKVNGVFSQISVFVESASAEVSNEVKSLNLRLASY